jgi:hypothetical protein
MQTRIAFQLSQLRARMALPPTLDKIGERRARPRETNWGCPRSGPGIYLQTTGIYSGNYYHFNE